MKRGEKKMKIVCVDDHPVMLSGLLNEVRRVLPKADIAGFSKGKDALSFVKQHGCDVLFCEIALRPDDGIQLAKAIQQDNPRVNIIFATVCSEKEYAKEVFHLRPSGYLVKPITEEQVREELHHLRYPIFEQQGASFPTDFLLKQEVPEEQLSAVAGGVRLTKGGQSKFRVGQSVSVATGKGIVFGKMDPSQKAGVILEVKQPSLRRRLFGGERAEYVYTVQYSDGSIGSNVSEQAITDGNPFQ